MKNIAFLSCQSLAGHVADDQLLVDELEQNGDFKISTIPWDQREDWSRYDLVVIRTTWDYHHRPEEFVKVLKEIEKQTRLVNSSKVVEWNYNKKYLKELHERGVYIVPTVFFRYPQDPLLPSDWEYPRLVVKPAISANSFKTMILSREDFLEGRYKKELFEGDWMLQPFLEEIHQGEYSLHYFNRKFSHAILKVPKAGDFRVQEEHGGIITKYEPNEELLEACSNILAHVPDELLYARVDLVPFQGKLALMELEMIEPALYFRKDPEAAKNFHREFKKLF